MLLNTVLEVLTKAIGQGNEIKGIKIGKQVKLTLFTEYMILYLENFKEVTKRSLEVTNKFSKVAGYKINTQKSTVFLYTSKKCSKKEIKKIIPFTIASKSIKYLKINLTKEVKDLYFENYKHC